MLYIFGGLATFVDRRPHRRDGGDGARSTSRRTTRFFVVAHLHTVLIGGAVFPLLAGLYYFFPLRQRQAAVGAARTDRVLADVRRLQRHVPADARARAARHAAPGVHLSGRARLRDAEPGLHHRRVHPRRRHRRGRRGTSCGRSAAQPLAPRNPWNAGTLEWLQEMPGQPWGMRSIPEIDSRYPLWDQPNFLRDVDEGRFYLPDAEEGRREMLVTTTVDADADAVPAHRRADLHHAGRGGLRRRHLHLRHLQAVRPGRRQRRAGAGVDPRLAVDRHRRDSREGDARTSASACTCRSTCRGRDVGRLVGDVHHDAGGLHGVRLAASSATSSTGRSTQLSAATPRHGPDAGVAARARRVLVAASWALHRRPPALERRRSGRRRSTPSIGPGASAARCSALRRLDRRTAGVSPLDPAASVYAATVWLLVRLVRSCTSRSASSCSCTASRGGSPGA